MMIRFLPTVVLVYLFCLPLIGDATTCDCRPEFNTDAEGPGTCSKTKQDATWCKLKFSGGNIGVNTTEYRAFSEKMTALRLPNFDPATADRVLSEQPPETWTVDTVKTHFSALFAAALWNTSASDRLKTVVDILQTKAEAFLPAIIGNGKFEMKPYTVNASRGCLQFSEAEFSVMVRTKFAKSPPTTCRM